MFLIFIPFIVEARHDHEELRWVEDLKDSISVLEIARIYF